MRPMDIPREHVVRESGHRIHDPIGPEKLARLGAGLGLAEGDTVLDLASGSGEMLCTWARDHGVSGVGVDLSPDFTAAARARAAELGVADRVGFVHGEAAAYAAAYDGEPVGVAACLGATWIGGGLLGTVDLLAGVLRPGGLVLVGHPYWRREPDSDEVVRGCHAESRETWDLLPALLRSVGDHGWDVVQMVLADQDDWDTYVAAQWLTTRRWLDAHPDDELWPRLRAELDTAAVQHVTYQREWLGWGVFALLRR